MEPWFKRLLKEKDDLQKRILKLEIAILEGKLPKESIPLIQAQLSAMKMYRDIMSQRIQNHE